MGPATLREAVALVAGRVPTEASGGITLDTIRADRRDRGHLYLGRPHHPVGPGGRHRAGFRGRVIPPHRKMGRGTMRSIAGVAERFDPDT